ncbi:TIM-barrel domain-containing protein [Agathobacter sp.]|uniref:glycoside hydrolase family 31 protein n=2 Tax=Agathobacter sp. TaxID=2021311 RepID=UPI003AB5709C
MRNSYKSYKIQDNTAELIYENGSLFVTIFENNIVHVAQKPGIESVAIEEGFIPKAVTPNMTCKDTSDAKGTAAEAGVSDAAVKAVISARDITVYVKDNEKLDIYYKGKLVLSDYEKARKKSEKNPYEDLAIAELEGHTVGKDEEKTDSVTIIKKLGKDDAIYGLGDKPGCLNKRGYSYVNWNTDDPAPHVDSFKSLYKSIPFFIVLGDEYCYGIFADNTYKTTFDFGFENTDYYFVEHEKGELDYYFMPGNDMAEVVGLYTSLTGTTPLYQRWIYGSHQSRWGYYTQDEVLDIADKFRKLDIPCDVIHMDIDYMNGYRVFTFDDKKFPDVKGLSEKLADRGVKLISIIDPGVKKDEDYFMYKEGMEMDAFAHDTDGSVYENAVWPGTSVFPDFTKQSVRSWWGDKTKILLEHGISGIWNDMNEPASFNGPLPDDVQFEYGAHEKVHNIYGHFMAKATYEGLAKNDGGKRPFVLTRAAYAGSQKYCGGWTGDNHSIWAHIALSLEQVCNLSVSGLAMCGSDIGGFGSDTTPELLVRFYEAAVFVPFFRNHSAMGTRRQEPWQFDETTIDAVRKTVKLRYRFIPYIYDLAHECEKTGAPIVRPLVYEYPEDKHVRNISDEYMLGSFVLVAPVIAPGKEAREVYLPDGDWYDYYTGEKYSGGRYILADAPLDKVPVFIKAGAIIPVADGEIRSTEDITEDKISILTYPGKGSFVHYQDDNETFAYRDGEYNAVEYTLDGDKLEKKVLHKGL